MLENRPFFRKVQFWQYVVPLLFLLLWVLAFWHELEFVGTWVRDGFRLSSDPEVFPAERDQLQIAALAVVSLILYFLLAIFVTSQFVLPLQAWGDRLRVFKRLLYYFLGVHGPAAAVQEGEQVANPEELRSSRPGVIFVDLASAVVLERQTYILRTQGRRNSPLARLVRLFSRRQRRISTAAATPNARAAGPGIVFTQAGERLRGVVSLRKQFRTRPNTRAVTRDGFEVSGTMVCIFTLGEPPDVIRVMYDGAETPENLKAIELRERLVQPPGQPISQQEQYVHRLIAEELDEPDRREVHRFAGAQMFTPAPPAPPVRPVMTPYVFDQKRVFDAVFGGARLLNENRVEPWTDLPIRVAVEIFHNMISLMKYDDLYRPDEPDDFPLFTEFRPRFMRAVRNQGVLSFQYIRRRDRQPITEGMTWNEAELEIYPVTPLTNSKILRNRGIKINVASFSELRPTNQLVLQRRLDTWQARWQGEASLGRAPFDRQVILSYAQERAQVQSEIIQMLYPQLNRPSATSDAIAVSVLQALEGFAADRNTRALLPRNTIDLFRSLNRWLPAPPRQGPPLPPERDEGDLE